MVFVMFLWYKNWRIAADERRGGGMRQQEAFNAPTWKGAASEKEVDRKFQAPAT
jgi:hypothetical protein